MSKSDYEEYKKNLARSERKREDFHGGWVRLIIGALLLLYTALILPFSAKNAGEICGDELEAARAFYPEKVCYFEDLRLLEVKTDAEDGRVYCVAEFSDCGGDSWIISFTPGRDKPLADNIRHGQCTSVSGYLKIGFLNELPFEADSFYTVYGAEYAEGQNMLSLNGEYLCGGDENYTLQSLLRPGIPLASLLIGIFGVISGGISLLRSRPKLK